MQVRSAQLKRVTKETQIALKLVIDGKGKSSIKTGVPFFDHMLTLFAKHAVMDLTLRCKGDLEVDAHHTVEDCGIALGQAPSKPGEKPPSKTVTPPTTPEKKARREPPRR